MQHPTTATGSSRLASALCEGQIAAWFPASRVVLDLLSPMCTPVQGDTQGLEITCRREDIEKVCGLLRRPFSCPQAPSRLRRALAQSTPPTATTPPTASAAKVGL